MKHLTKTIFIFFVGLSFLLPGYGNARKKKGGYCPCTSGCGLNTDGLSADVKQLMVKARSNGRVPVSCVRTQACQDRLRSCYENRCGQYGRAARISAHSDGKACDYLPHHKMPLRGLRNQMGLKRISDLTHGSRQGGWLHVYTSQYTKSASNSTPPKAKGEHGVSIKPQQAPLLPERAPAAEGRYSQMPNGKYKCPTGLQSICGSTRDFPWCQQWIQTGKTPGCY